MTEAPRPAEDLTSAERIAHINAQRARIGTDDEPSEEELKYAVELMRTERSVNAGRTAEKKEKVTTTPVSLDDI